MSKPAYWILLIDGIPAGRFSQRAAANGAAIVARCNGHSVEVRPIGY